MAPGTCPARCCKSAQRCRSPSIANGRGLEAIKDGRPAACRTGSTAWLPNGRLQTVWPRSASDPQSVGRWGPPLAQATPRSLLGLLAWGPWGAAARLSRIRKRPAGAPTRAASQPCTPASPPSSLAARSKRWRSRRPAAAAARSSPRWALASLAWLVCRCAHPEAAAQSPVGGVAATPAHPSQPHRAASARAPCRPAPIRRPNPNRRQPRWKTLPGCCPGSTSLRSCWRRWAPRRPPLRPPPPPRGPMTWTAWRPAACTTTCTCSGAACGWWVLRFSCAWGGGGACCLHDDPHLFRCGLAGCVVARRVLPPSSAGVVACTQQRHEWPVKCAACRLWPVGCQRTACGAPRRRRHPPFPPSSARQPRGACAQPAHLGAAAAAAAVRRQRGGWARSEAWVPPLWAARQQRARATGEHMLEAPPQQDCLAPCRRLLSFHVSNPHAAPPPGPTFCSSSSPLRQLGPALLGCSRLQY